MAEIIKIREEELNDKYLLPIEKNLASVSSYVDRYVGYSTFLIARYYDPLNFYHVFLVNKNATA